VDVDQGVLDSITDIQKELRKQGGFSIVSEEANAGLRLYVVRRQVDAGPTVGIGSTVQGTGTATAMPTKIRTLETLLRVDAYERAFIAEDHDYDSRGNAPNGSRKISRRGLRPIASTSA